MGFNLADVLKDVPNLDTERKQIEYIRLDLIDGDPNNFYQLSGIEDLAANIATCDLQQPLLVREKDDCRYIIVSGHRRRAALELLAKDDPERWQEVPCIVERDTVSPALQQLRLIYANANTRAVTSAELGEQAAQVEKLLYQLKEEGYEFPGRMRDHVAQAVNASKSKLARLKVIRDNLAECWNPDYKSGTLNESAAYELAHMLKEWQEIFYKEKMAQKANIRWISAQDVETFMDRSQKIEKIPCKKLGQSACQNRAGKRKQVAHCERYWTTPCTQCCDACDKLATCKNSCPLLSDKIKQLRAEKKEERRQEQLAVEKKERPVIEYIQGVYARVGKVRQERGVSVKDLFKAQSVYYAKTDDDKQSDMESGNAKINTLTTLPFGYSFRYDDAKSLCAVADLLGCTTDYLLGRTEYQNTPIVGIDFGDPAGDMTVPVSYPTPENVTNSDTDEAPDNVSSLGAGWRTGMPNVDGEYIVLVKYVDDDAYSPDKFFWSGVFWFYHGIKVQDLGIFVDYWMPIPPDIHHPEQDTKQQEETKDAKMQ